MIVINSSVSNFNSCLQRIALLSFQQFSMNSPSFTLDIAFPIKRICYHVPNNLHSLWKVVFENRHHIACVFSWSIGVQLSTYVFHSYLQFLPCPIFCAFEMKMLKEVGSSTGWLCLVSTSALDEDSDAGDVSGHNFGGNSDSILEFG